MSRILNVASDVVCETIEGETIIIHLTTGTYYSLDGAGVAVWTLIEHGVSRSESIREVAALYPNDTAAAEIGLGRLIDQLVSEGLVVESEAAGHESLPSLAELIDPGASFEAPVLAVYTDMQEFLLADPLHDVEEGAGWPHVKVT
jgi:hypothetical protein